MSCSVLDVVVVELGQQIIVKYQTFKP